jgi:hypothetical protein
VIIFRLKMKVSGKSASRATNHDVTVQGGSSGQESVMDGGLLFAISKLKNKSLSLFDVI